MPHPSQRPPSLPHLTALLDQQAAQHPHAHALRGPRTPDGNEPPALSYRDLKGRAMAMAGHLVARLGVRAGDRVAYLGFNQTDQIVLLFALGHLSAMLVPLNHRLAPAEWQTTLADCGASLLIHDEHWAQAGAALARASALTCAPLASLAGPSNAAGPGAWPASAAHPETPVLLVYTSGTTGRPRGAVHTHGNLLANMAIAAGSLQIVPQDVVATLLPLFHVGGLCIQTLPALYAGASVIVFPRFDPAAALDCFCSQRPTLTVQVPATMKALIEHPDWVRSDISSLRAMCAGSSVLPAALIEAIHARGVPVCNVYGATETGPYSIALTPAQAREHVGSCGWPASAHPSLGLHVQARLQPLDASRPSDGEVLLRGPNVVARYWPEVPACDSEGWFHTGDLARCNSDGSYTIVGRSKDLIISGGENIHPAEIELVLAEHPWVAECAVIGMPDPRWGETVAAVVVLQPDVFSKISLERASNIDDSLSNWEQMLTDHLSARLARFKLPRHWFARDTLPRTALGKVQKGDLKAALLATTQGTDGARA